MKNFGEKSVLDVKSSQQHDLDDAARQVKTVFELKAREIIPVQIVRDEHPVNPLADALKGVRV